MNLADVGRYWARWHPHDTAIRWAGRDVTWSELDARTGALAAGLHGRGVGKA